MDPIERTVNVVLTAGIVVTVALLVAGLVLSIAQGQGLPTRIVPLADLPALLAELDPAAYLSLGIVVLIATPFVRVAGTIVAFARERDRRYVLVTAVVLVVMCAERPARQGLTRGAGGGAVRGRRRGRCPARGRRPRRGAPRPSRPGATRCRGGRRRRTGPRAGAPVARPA